MRDRVLVLRADPGELRGHHRDYSPKVSDLERMTLIAAERALLSLKVIFWHSDMGELAMSRVIDRLDTIQRALNLKRPALGLAVTRAGEAA